MTRYFIVAVGNEWDGKAKGYSSLKEAVKVFLSGKVHDEYPQAPLLLEELDFSIPSKARDYRVEVKEGKTSTNSTPQYYLLSISQHGGGDGRWGEGRHSLKQFNSLDELVSKGFSRTKNYERNIIAKSLTLKFGEAK